MNILFILFIITGFILLIILLTRIINNKNVQKECNCIHHDTNVLFKYLTKEYIEEELNDNILFLSKYVLPNGVKYEVTYLWYFQSNVYYIEVRYDDKMNEKIIIKNENENFLEDDDDNWLSTYICYKDNSDCKYNKFIKKTLFKYLFDSEITNSKSELKNETDWTNRYKILNLFKKNKIRSDKLKKVLL